MKKYNRKKANAGITLIALIITVIVMLILAGVAINLTIGDNGIFRKSEEGAKIYQNAANNETASLNGAEQEMGDLINQYHGGTTTQQPTPTEEPNPTPTTEPSPSPTVPAEKPGKPNEGGIYTENSTINGEEGNAFNPEIPKGFKPVDVDDAVWGDGSTPPTEDSVKKGLVIEDAEGNQFVWVAVDGNTVKLNRYTFASNGAETGVGEAGIIGSQSYVFQELASSSYGNAVAKDINAFKSSVATHGGYYFARYEASYGVDGKPNSKASTSYVTQSGSAYVPNKEGQLWANIKQVDASRVCRNMYDSNYGAISDLVNSYAWDTAIVFIQKYSGESGYSMRLGSSVNGDMGNTGVSTDQKCHIYDMASNCFEWTTETYNYSGAYWTRRGGKSR